MQLAIVGQNYIATVKSGFKRMRLYFRRNILLNLPYLLSACAYREYC